MKRTLILPILAFSFLMSATAADAPWSVEKANEWYSKVGWQVGCNFGPSTAINQLEMFQADTFDAKTIDRELGWAEDIGFNSIRVYLHDLLWKQDAEGFLKRLDQFLAIADKHKIKVLFVLLDSVWDPFPKQGEQRAPKPHLHNSGWVQSPGQEILKDPKRHDELEGYIKGVIGRFKDDPRVVVWDIMNEPENPNPNSYNKVEFPEKEEMAFALIQKAYAWAREIGPSQPITSGAWSGDWYKGKITPLYKFMLEQSDVISFHCYDDINDMKARVEFLKRYNRPIFCTEYMARVTGSTFQNILPYLKQQNVAAYNWGFVAGKTQTIYPWDSWTKTYTAEPPVWFHDIFRANGEPYRQEEVDCIKSLTLKK